MQRCAPEHPLYGGPLTEESALFTALADPARLRILATLARAAEELCVCDFTSGLGINQPTVSHHLKILKEAGLVISERRGTWGFYRLADAARSRVDAALERALPVAVLA